MFCLINLKDELNLLRSLKLGDTPPILCRFNGVRFKLINGGLNVGSGPIIS